MGASQAFSHRGRDEVLLDDSDEQVWQEAASDSSDGAWGTRSGSSRAASAQRTLVLEAWERIRASGRVQSAIQGGGRCCTHCRGVRRGSRWHHRLCSGRAAHAPWRAKSTRHLRCLVQPRLVLSRHARAARREICLSAWASCRRWHHAVRAVARRFRPLLDRSVRLLGLHKQSTGLGSPQRTARQRVRKKSYRHRYTPLLFTAPRAAVEP